MIFSHETVHETLDGETIGIQPEAPAHELTAARDAGNGSWAPRLECYEDMRDFLVVDAIHDGDDAGWRSRKANATRAAH